MLMIIYPAISSCYLIYIYICNNSSNNNINIIIVIGIEITTMIIIIMIIIIMIIIIYIYISNISDRLIDLRMWRRPAPPRPLTLQLHPTGAVPAVFHGVPL